MRDHELDALIGQERGERQFASARRQDDVTATTQTNQVLRFDAAAATNCIDGRPRGIEDHLAVDRDFGSGHPIEDLQTAGMHRDDFGVVREDAASIDGGHDIGDGQPGVLGSRIVELQRRLQPRGPQAGKRLRGGLRGQFARSRQRAATGEARIHPSAESHLPTGDAAVGIERHQHRQRPHQVWSEPQQPFAFVQRFLDEGDVTVLQVAQTAVHQSTAARTRTRRDIARFQQQRGHATDRSLTRQSRALDAGADHDHVKGLAIKLSGIGSHLPMDCCVLTDTGKG